MEGIMDIDLSNLSKKGRNNFVNFYEKKTHIKFKKFPILTSIGIFFSIIAAAMIPLLYYFFTNDSKGSSYEIILIIVVLIIISIAIFISFLLKKSENEKMKKFFEDYSDNGIFNYCFECNKEITPVSEYCPNCNTNVKLKFTQKNIHGFKDFKSLTAKTSTSYMFYIIILVNVCNIIYRNNNTAMSFSSEAGRTQAKLDFLSNNIHEYKATKDNAKAIYFGNAKNKKPYLLYKLYYGPKFLPQIINFYGINNYLSVNAFCESYNKKMQELINDSKK